ncbi:hypothetical protein RAS2_21810 [Phycisphaerae bacterium RAS2]|nr:hypothetical protein RAS2_21810 [Phycisphaerae bacterium RAS2]
MHAGAIDGMKTTSLTPRCFICLIFLLLGQSAGCSEVQINSAFAIEQDGKKYAANFLYAADDPYRIVLSNYEFANVYLFRKEPSGSYQTLFPDPRINDGRALLFSDSHVILPPEGHYNFPLENGVTHFLLIVTTQRIDDLNMLGLRKRIDASVVDDVVANLAELPGTRVQDLLEPLTVRVGTGSPIDLAEDLASFSESFSGHRLVVISNSSKVSIIARFALRYEIR